MEDFVVTVYILSKQIFLEDIGVFVFHCKHESLLTIYSHLCII